MTPLQRLVILLLWGASLPFCVLWPSSAIADTDVAVIPSARADELVPILAPMAAPEGGVSVWQDQLIIRATPEKLARIRETLRAIDKPLRNLTVHVRHAGIEAKRQQSFGAEGSVVIRNGHAGGRLEIQADDRHMKERHQSEYSMRALEGSTLFIATGTDVPVITFAHGPEGTGFTQGYVPVQSGMRVTPRILPDGMVLLTVDFQEASLSMSPPGAINRSGASSQLKIRADEWTVFGNISSREFQQQSGVFGHSRISTSRHAPLEIKVDVDP